MNATLILSFQVALALACPPIAVGMRKLFLSDLWCLFWVSGCFSLSLIKPRLLEKAGIPRIEFKNKKIRNFFLGSAVLLIFVFLHGYLRPSLAAPLQALGLTLNESDAFEWRRELFSAVRFLSWLWAACIVFLWTRTGALKPQILTAFTKGATVFCALVIIASRFYNPFRQMLGRIYGYDPNYIHWADRYSGTFTSPVEAAAVLVFVGILIFDGWVALGILLLAALLTKTISTLVGVTFAIFVVRWIGNKKISSQKLATLGLILSITLGCLLVALFFGAQFSPFIQGKMLNLVFRLGPWKVYIVEAFNRPDLFLFGFGFAPYHSDSSYMFLFNRGGFLMLGTFVYFVADFLAKYWERWSTAQRLIPVFILVSGFTCDILIFRAVAAIAFTAGACTLALPKTFRDKK